MNKIRCFLNPILLIALLPIYTFAMSDVAAAEANLEVAEIINELFVEAVHTRESCGGNLTGCEVNLQKRIEDFHLIVAGQDSFLSDEVAQAAASALERTLSQISRSTGLKPIFEKPVGPVAPVFLVFVNREQYMDNSEGFISARVAPSSLGQYEDRIHYFNVLMKSDLRCLYYSTAYDDGVIQDVQIWIKVEISPEEMVECISEELFNSMGIDDGEDYPGIFDWPGVDADKRNGSKGLDLIHLSFLERLYQPDMKPNQTIQETKRLLGIE